ncbi:MAG TPA: hypothetical protein VFG79_11510 [Solirubrobacter sp.]|nr:hypothetical protein [Solirubrobacter sp.]
MEETWSEAIEAVVYELARRNGESPLDRGAALRRRVEALAEDGLAHAFEQLARERGWRGEENGDESEARAYARVYGVLDETLAAA